ncbi:MAG TPA: hypothetical protein DEP51_01935 [Clostridiales bacterium]|nr:hypothetical protein [Clostridiales bacterium]
MSKKKSLNVKKVLFFIIILGAIIGTIILYNNKSKNNKTEPSNITSDLNDSVSEEKDLKKEETVISEKTELEERLENGKYLSDSGLPVLMYHFFYDKNEREPQDGNWIEINDFEQQIKYLSENDYYFPTWEEVENYIDGKTELPEKSVVITVDDGDPSFFELGVPIIQKYNVKATSFVVAYWYGDVAQNKENNISYQSHSYDMHKGGSNGKGVMLSWSYEKMVEDLKASQDVLGGSNIFCYPFGQYNELDKKALKDTGFKLAFTTQGGRVKKGASKYELPRVRISGTTSIESFIKKVE